MERNVSLEGVSDGKRYGGNNLVKIDYGDCKGCSACRQGMGSSILLDPCDIERIEEGLYMSFNQLMAGHTELNVVSHVIPPNLRMTGDGERCSFLDRHSGCSTHPYRPGLYRLFPLGRVYEDRSFRCFLQIHECPRKNRTKVRVRKWVDILDFKSYERLVADWHYFLRDLEKRLKGSESQETMKAVNICVLNQFCVTPYKTREDFYPQSCRRLEAAAAIAAV